MTDIAIKPLERTQVPPSRVGEVKPPLSLADLSGEAGLAFATAQFAGARFDDVVKAKAANEHAAFQGIAAAEMEAFDTFVVSKPGASFEELEAERNKMVARIETAGKKATTKLAQQNNKNWMLRNKPNINAQTQTSMEAIRTQQALAAFNLHRKKLITNFKDNELIDLYASQVESGLMTKEFAAAQLAVDLDVLDAAQAKVAVGNASQIGFDLWQETGNLKDGLDAIEAIKGLTGAQKQNAESELKTRVGLREADDKVKAQEAETESVEQVSERLNKRQLDGIETFINGLPLTETQKTEQILRATNFSKAVNATKENIVTSDETNIAIDRNLNRIRNGELTYDEGLDVYRKLATNVNAKEGEQNLDDIRSAADDAVDPVLKRPVVIDGHASVDRIRAVRVSFVRADDKLDDKERAVLIAEIEREVLADKTELDQWARENVDKPNFTQEFQKQVNAINRPKVEEATLGFLSRSLRLSEKTFLLGRGAKVLGTSEEAALARKRMKVFKEQAPDLAKTLTKQEEASILERFRRGATVQDIIDLAR